MIAALLLAIPALLATPVAAQEGAAAALRDCVAAAERDPDAERACVGAQALACVDAAPASAQSADGVAGCYAAEAAAWDEVMNATFGDIVALIRGLALVENPSATAPGPQERLLQEAQSAWAAFRDADCAQAAAHWGDEPMRAAALARCRLERDAARALELIVRRRAYETP